MSNTYKASALVSLRAIMVQYMQIVVNNLLTNYELQGSGKLILFLHGWGDASAGSSQLQKDLAGTYQVLAPDLPGFGKSQAPPEGWNLDNYAVFVRELLQKLDLPEPFAVIGHSNGGAVAIRAIAMDAVTPEKLVLLAASGVRAQKSFKRASMQFLAKLGNAATIGMPERYRKALRKQLYKSAGSDMMVVESMQDTFKKIVRQDVQAEAAEVTQPTLLVFGANDKDVPPFMGERYNQLIANSHLEMLEGAGHFVHLDQPEKTTTMIKEFLA